MTREEPASSLWRRIIDGWRSIHAGNASGASSEAIAAFERKYHVVLPADVREYFMTIDGMGENDMDKAMNRFWPLGEVKPVEEELSDSRGVVYPDRFAYPDCFVFADHCMNCWDYAVKLTTDPTQQAPVYRVTASDEPGEQMAASFREFMVRYSDDPDSIV
jgi:hypothetical protein